MSRVTWRRSRRSSSSGFSTGAGLGSRRLLRTPRVPSGSGSGVVCATSSGTWSVRPRASVCSSRRPSQRSAREVLGGSAGYRSRVEARGHRGSAGVGPGQHRLRRGVAACIRVASGLEDRAGSPPGRSRGPCLATRSSPCLAPAEDRQVPSTQQARAPRTPRPRSRLPRPTLGLAGMTTTHRRRPAVSPQILRTMCTARLEVTLGRVSGPLGQEPLRPRWIERGGETCCVVLRWLPSSAGSGWPLLG